MGSSTLVSCSRLLHGADSSSLAATRYNPWIVSVSPPSLLALREGRARNPAHWEHLSGVGTEGGD